MRNKFVIMHSVIVLAMIVVSIRISSFWGSLIVVMLWVCVVVVYSQIKNWKDSDKEWG